MDSFSATTTKRNIGTPYFKSYQGGVYPKNKMCEGWLLDGFSSPGDAWFGKVFITHGGGKADSAREILVPAASSTTSSEEPKPAKRIKQSVLKESQQLTDKNQSALLGSHKTGKPIVVILGSNYTLLDFEVPARFCVAGYFVITHFWAEKEMIVESGGADAKGSGKKSAGKKAGKGFEKKRTGKAPGKVEEKEAAGFRVRWKFRGQWVENQKNPVWWEHAADAVQCREEGGHEDDENETQECGVCKQSTPLIYEEWFCCNPECATFWKIRVEEEGKVNYRDVIRGVDKLTYHPAFTPNPSNRSFHPFPQMLRTSGNRARYAAPNAVESVAAMIGTTGAALIVGDSIDTYPICRVSPPTTAHPIRFTTLPNYKPSSLTSHELTVSGRVHLNQDHIRVDRTTINNGPYKNMEAFYYYLKTGGCIVHIPAPAPDPGSVLPHGANAGTSQPRMWYDVEEDEGYAEESLIDPPRSLRALADSMFEGFQKPKIPLTRYRHSAHR
ncbi:hypothetical protein HK102_010224, partial [Quaeritorhiza haematococci]